MNGYTLTDSQVAIMNALKHLQGSQNILIAAHKIREVVNKKLDMTGYRVNADLTDLAGKKLIRSSKRAFYTFTREGRRITSHLQ